MGMFDSVMVPCPKCGQREEFQSKSGDCLCSTFELASAPHDVLADVNRHSPATCRKCGCVFKVKLKTHQVVCEQYYGTPCAVDALPDEEEDTQ